MIENFKIVFTSIVLGVIFNYGYYLYFDKTYTYQVEFHDTKPMLGLSGYWSPRTTYDIKGANKCDDLITLLKNEYEMPVKSCKMLDERVYWQEFRE